MAKVKLKTILKKDGLKVLSNNILGILTEQKIQYKDDNTLMVILFKEDLITLKRTTETAELLLNFSLNKTLQGTYYLKEFDRTFKINITTTYIKQKEGYLCLKYLQELGEEKTNFEFALAYEVIK